MRPTSSNTRRAAGALASALVLAAVGTIGTIGPGTAASAGGLSAPKAPPILPLPPPGDFVQRVDNRYSPFLPGTKWVYASRTPKGEERIVVEVLNRTKMIAGIRATVVNDVVRRDGELIEATFDWYAQDRRGNVWYLGENTKEYRHGAVVSTEGSWEAGVDGASAGVMMFAHPNVGQPYRQEYYAGHAEDQAKVLTLSTQAATPAGEFVHVRMTEDTTALDANAVEMKFYAPGVGVVQELDLSPEFARTELLYVHRPALG